jgi:fucose permease
MVGYKQDVSAETGQAFTAGVWLFIAVVFLYGYCETIFANWAIIFLKKERSLSSVYAGYALASFWAMVTAGRLLVSLLTVRVSASLVYRVLPVMMAAAMWAVTKAESDITGIILFGFAGLACSAFFPLSFSFAQKKFAYMAEKVSGGLMASYILGYGLASYGIGKVVELNDIKLGNLYGYSIVIALGITVLGIILTRPAALKAG